MGTQNGVCGTGNGFRSGCNYISRVRYPINLMLSYDDLDGRRDDGDD